MNIEYHFYYNLKNNLTSAIFNVNFPQFWFQIPSKSLDVNSDPSIQLKVNDEVYHSMLIRETTKKAIENEQQSSEESSEESEEKGKQ